VPALIPRLPVRHPNRGPCEAATLLHLAVAALLLAVSIGAWVAEEPTSAITALVWMCAGALTYLVTFVLTVRRSWWRPVALTSALAGAALAAYVVLQYRHLGYGDKLRFVTMVGGWSSAWLPRLAIWAPYPNSIATLLEGLLPLAFGLSLGHGSRRVRQLGVVAGLLIANGLLVTASRGAWIAELAAMTVWAVAARGRSRPIWRVAAPALTAAGIVLATLMTLALAAAQQAEASTWLAAIDRPDRLDLYRHSLSLVRDFPFSGIGLGDQFTMVLSRHALLIEVPFLTYSHNLFLELWLETGLLGAMAWVSLVAAVLVGAVAGERTELGSGFRGAYLGLVAVFVHGLCDARQSVDGWTWLPLFALLGLMAARLARTKGRVTWPGFSAWVLAPLALLLGVVAWVWPADAAWHANLGGLREIHASAPGLTPALRRAAIASAEGEYLRSVTIDPRQPTAHRRLGLLAMAQERFDDAVRHLEVAASAVPENWTTRKALGLAYMWTGNVEQASHILESLGGADIVGELNTWSWWRESRGEVALAMRAAQVSLRLLADPEIEQRVAHLRNRAEEQNRSQRE
jgi:O-antigen ligase